MRKNWVKGPVASRPGGERATVVVGGVAALLSVGYFIALVLLTWNFHTLRTSAGYPLAADYANYWSAAKLALAGKPALAYHLDDLYQMQQQFFGTHSRYGSGWYYPPPFLLAVLPLGLMPYLPSLFIWLGVTLALYLLVLSRISTHPVFLPLCLTFTGIGENLVFGQNGFLSGTLLGGGLLLLERSPLAAGCLFGLLSYKPHLLVLIIPALICGRYWKVLSVTLAMALGLIFLSIMAFGYQIWPEYFKVMAFPMHELEVGSASWRIIPTFFAAALAAGFGVRSAFLVQGVVMVVVLVGVAWVWSKKISLPLRGAVLVLGALLFTPYAFVYDLAILALPLAWLWEEGRRHGRRMGELLLLLVGWLMPGAVALLYNGLKILGRDLKIGPVILLALFGLALIKTKQPIYQENP